MVKYDFERISYNNPSYVDLLPIGKKLLSSSTLPQPLSLDFPKWTAAKDRSRPLGLSCRKIFIEISLVCLICRLITQLRLLFPT